MEAQLERERSILEDQVQRLTRALAKTHDALTAKEAEVQRVQAELEVKERDYCTSVENCPCAC